MWRHELETSVVGAITLPQQTADALRVRFSAVNDTGWVLSLAAREGWLQANREYLGAMRERGAEEMAEFMAAAGISRPASLDEALQLLTMGLSFWTSGVTIKRLASEKSEVVVNIRVVDCPVYAEIEKAGWRGVTACGNGHRRLGWYDALGIEAEDCLLREKKWGYGACVIQAKLRPSHSLS